MKTLNRYLLRQVIATLVMTAAVFTVVLLLGNGLREILPLLISQKATFGIMAQLFGLLIPFIAVFALPMGMLTATLLVFGRFSADQELTAARASGISLLSLATPILIFSLLLCGISAVVNLEIGPRSRVAYNSVRFNLRAALVDVQLPEGRYIEFPGNPSYTVYVGRNRDRELQDILIRQISDETNLDMKVSAPRGRLEFDRTNHLLLLKLTDAQIIYVPGSTPMVGAGNPTIKLDLNASKESAHKPGISDMTFSELRAELDRVEGGGRLALPGTNGDATSQDSKRRVKVYAGDIAEPIRVQIHRRVAFSFACFGFTLIGIPLGIRMHRRETNVGVAVALLLVAAYYGFIVLADSLSDHSEYVPHLIVWVPNFIFQAVGAVLLWRANRGA